MRLHQALADAGRLGEIGVLGLSGANNWKTRHALRMEGADTVYVVLDNEPPVARRLAGRDRQPTLTHLHSRSRRAQLRRHRPAREAPGELSALDAGKQTFASFVKEWWRLHAEPNLTAKTRETYRGRLKTHLLPRIGNVPLRKLDVARIQTMAAEMQAAGVPADARRKSLTLLHTILEHAARWQRITHNPARYVKKPPADPKRLIEPLSPRQVESLRTELVQRGWLRDAALVSVLAYAGFGRARRSRCGGGTSASRPYGSTKRFARPGASHEDAPEPHGPTIRTARC